jgi:hypothetical protein
MTQPPKEKSLVVEALIQAQFNYEWRFGERSERTDKAIRIAEIEEQISELSIRYARGGAHPYEFAERMRILATEHSKATHD